MKEVARVVFLNRVCTNWKLIPQYRDGITQTIAELYGLTFSSAEAMIQSRIDYMKLVGKL